ncbi:hypothetical protein BMS3Bbin05_01597 [bacterium BMS3Bbin05]|nr:hypothetical protein BMS3Bbin05_01597 [bacterium BMS3Bbin05]
MSPKSSPIYPPCLSASDIYLVIVILIRVIIIKMTAGTIKTNNTLVSLKKYMKHNIPDIVPNKQYKKPNHDTGRLTAAPTINIP